MKLGTRLFLAHAAILVTCLAYPVYWITENLRVRYLEGVEEPLVDEANLLAAFVGKEMERAHFKTENLYDVFEELHTRKVSAQIYDLMKKDIDSRVYITDSKGKVTFDSESRENIGADYSGWRDVQLTLQGKYGARSTRQDPNDPSTSILHVAAPIINDGKIIGSLTVAKPTTTINAFLETAKPKILKIAVLAALAAVALGFWVSYWLTGQVRKLTTYANDMREGKKSAFPRLARTELKEMGRAFEKMREALDGKQYVEEYVHTLTHEIKSPVSAIRGASELLQEGVPAEKQTQFLANIRNETLRISDLLDRMLKLSELETRKALTTVEPVSLNAIAGTILKAMEPMIVRKNLRIESAIPADSSVAGDPFLLHQAMANLIQNAIDFSPEGGTIKLEAEIRDRALLFSVQDEGPGIPSYAKEKLFQRFFSLPRPDTGLKSTGLGLNFVREVAHLHKGEIDLQNLPERGLRARLHLPV